MSTPRQAFRDALSRWFLPGAIYTFVGAGGKTTAMKAVAAFLAQGGIKARLTTTTRVGIDELKDIPLSLIRDPADLARAVADSAPVRLLVSTTMHDRGKHRGLDPRLIEDLAVQGDTVLLVEGDGSRKLPMKAPRSHEPVIPANTAAVFALMGAIAFGERITEKNCYNHRKALALTGETGGFFGAREIARLAGDPEGCRKGILSGMGFRLLINQGDLEARRRTASEALRLAREHDGIRGALVSFRKEELYDATDD
jgi:probable selenium-dependent hydroxylase accessory protein YqeC